MAVGAAVYLVYCAFDPDRRGELSERRPAHLRHILASRDQIVFGGLVGAAGEPPEALVLLMRADSAAEVEAVIERDPYATLWLSTEVREFQLRLPEAYDGQLQDILDQLTASADDGR